MERDAAMNFEQALKFAAAAVEARLAEILAAQRRGGRGPERLIAAMEHALLGGGKRFRPLLVMETATLFDAPAEPALQAAAAVECLHCYSLVHDDLPAMDDDALRRGRPTVHIAFDEATAILAGDALQTLAFEVLGGVSAEPAIVLELVQGLAVALGARGMAGGQQLDMAAETQQLLLAEIKTLQAMKTGALIAFSVDAGAVLGRAKPDERASLRRYAEALGLAFQISDDLLDKTGDPAKTGKATGKDAGAGKATFVSLLGEAGARAELAKAEAEAIAALQGFGAKADGLRAAAKFVSKRTG